MILLISCEVRNIRATVMRYQYGLSEIKSAKKCRFRYFQFGMKNWLTRCLKCYGCQKLLQQFRQSSGKTFERSDKCGFCELSLKTLSENFYHFLEIFGEFLGKCQKILVDYY